jgi:hypothetical protein
VRGWLGVKLDLGLRRKEMESTAFEGRSEGAKRAGEKLLGEVHAEGLAEVLWPGSRTDFVADQK